jgi:two-component system sensor histidine kinase UhpB
LIDSIEEEKRNIALSLHDETSQTLAAVKNELEMLMSRIPANDQKSKKSLEVIRRHILNMTEGTRRISYSLHPSQLEDLGLVPAINWYAEKFVRSKRLKVEVGDAGFNEELPLYVGLTLYRIAQEALANVVRHADAKNVEVKITKGYPEVIMVITDDGKGFDTGASSPIKNGLGIIGMRERVEGLNGSFRIKSSPGMGTSIRVTLPLEVENDG